MNLNATEMWRKENVKQESDEFLHSFRKKDFLT